jgi:hypothetical protein
LIGTPVLQLLRQACLLTYDQALHLILSHDIHTQRIANLIVELVCSSARGHDGQLAGLGAVARQLLVAQVAHELDAVVDAVRLEAEEVEATAGLGRVGFAGEVDEFGEGAADLEAKAKAKPRVNS